MRMGLRLGMAISLGCGCRSVGGGLFFAGFFWPRLQGVGQGTPIFDPAVLGAERGFTRQLGVFVYYEPAGCMRACVTLS
jgi:hypothetical protein